MTVTDAFKIDYSCTDDLRGKSRFSYKMLAAHEHCDLEYKHVLVIVGSKARLVSVGIATSYVLGKCPTDT